MIGILLLNSTSILTSYSIQLALDWNRFSFSYYDDPHFPTFSLDQALAKKIRTCWSWIDCLV